MPNDYLKNSIIIELQRLNSDDYLILTDEEKQFKQKKLDMLYSAYLNLCRGMHYEDLLNKYREYLPNNVIETIESWKEEVKRNEEIEEANTSLGILLFILGFGLFAFACVGIQNYDQSVQEHEQKIAQEKTNRFNSCMKDYKDKYINNQDTFVLLQEKKLHNSLSKLSIQGSLEQSFGFGTGEIKTKYIDKVYKKNKFEKENEWTNTCRKQKYISEQVDVILKKTKE